MCGWERLRLNVMKAMKTNEFVVVVDNITK